MISDRNTLRHLLMQPSKVKQTASTFRTRLATVYGCDDYGLSKEIEKRG
jgi:hypothetical protein